MDVFLAERKTCLIVFSMFNTIACFSVLEAVKQRIGLEQRNNKEDIVLTVDITQCIIELSIGHVDLWNIQT